MKRFHFEPRAKFARERPFLSSLLLVSSVIIPFFLTFQVGIWPSFDGCCALSIRCSVDLEGGLPFQLAKHTTKKLNVAPKVKSTSNMSTSSDVRSIFEMCLKLSYKINSYGYNDCRCCMIPFANLWCLMPNQCFFVNFKQRKARYGFKR